MEENINLWNKKASDLTVAESMTLSVAVPIMMIGCAAAAVTVVVVADKITTKFRTVRMNRKLNKIKIVED